MGNHRADRRGHSRGPSVTPVDSPVSSPAPGRRRADKQTSGLAARRSSRRGPLFRGLPSAPILLGVAALVASGFGAVTATDTGLVGATNVRFLQASALTGASDISRVNLLDSRSATVSRSSSRTAGAGDKLVAQAENQAKARNATLAKFAKQAEAQAAKIARNQWVLPLGGYRLTATFGQYGLWASSHTGLDFAAPSGTPIVAMANGVISSVGYDGSYGNKTVITLEDGTELWYAHQTSYIVSVGQEVRAGEVVGYVGSTGNSTGSHLHLEVRPGGGDPVDPYTALVYRGLTP